VKPNEPVWMEDRPPISFARMWVVECGPQLLRVADAE
jgi:hypothetical protein